MVRVGLHGDETSTGLIHGQHYVVKDVGDADADGVNDRFKIATYDANGTVQLITMSAAAAENVTFTKVEKGLKVQAMARDANLKGTTVTLVDKELPTVSILSHLILGKTLLDKLILSPLKTYLLLPHRMTKAYSEMIQSRKLEKNIRYGCLGVRNAQRMMSAVDGIKACQEEILMHEMKNGAYN